MTKIIKKSSFIEKIDMIFKENSRLGEAHG